MSVVATIAKLGLAAYQGISARNAARGVIGERDPAEYEPVGWTGSGSGRYWDIRPKSSSVFTPKPIDVATPVSFTPDQPIVGEQQQYQNLVTKPMLTQATSAQIAQAEPTRMVMQARQPTRRVAVRRVARKPVRRIAARKPVRRVTRRAPRRYF